jgi:hypothetical protein
LGAPDAPARAVKIAGCREEAQMLTTLMPLRPPGLSRRVRQGGALLDIRHGQLHQQR